MFDAEDTVRIVRDACHGLDYAHRASVIHRDVKPGNLLVASETGTTKLADFGIAKAAEQTRITQVGSVLGTAAYLSPEQAAGEETGVPSDIYSLGVCAYQFLTGRLDRKSVV
jgi:serine/threonine protein kinase